MGTPRSSDDYCHTADNYEDIFLLHTTGRDGSLHHHQICSLSIDSPSSRDPLPHPDAITATTTSTTTTTTTAAATTDPSATAIINVDQSSDAAEPMICCSKLSTSSCNIAAAAHPSTSLTPPSPIDQYLFPPLRKLRTSIAPTAAPPPIDAIGSYNSSTNSDNPIGTHCHSHLPNRIASGACDASSSSCSNKLPGGDLHYRTVLYDQSMCPERGAGLDEQDRGTKEDCNDNNMNEHGSISVISKLSHGKDCVDSTDIAAGPCIEVHEEDEQSCETPKAKGNMIPAAEVCPPAPKKKKASFYKSFKRRLRSNYHPYAHQDQNSSSSSPSPSPPSSPPPPPPPFSINYSTVPNLHLPPQPRFFVPPDLHSLPESIQSLFK